MNVSAHALSSNESEKQSLRLERYKYVLSQKKDLNERAFKVIAAYQAAIILACSAQYKVVVDSKGKLISVKSAFVFSWSIFTIVCLLSVAVIVLISSGLMAWMKYRRDESDIEKLVFGSSRNQPTWSDCLRWYETYFLLGCLLVPCAYLILISFLTIG